MQHDSSFLQPPVLTKFCELLSKLIKFMKSFKCFAKYIKKGILQMNIKNIDIGYLDIYIFNGLSWILKHIDYRYRKNIRTLDLCTFAFLWKGWRVSLVLILTNTIFFIVILYNFEINRPPLSSILTWML